MVTWQIDRDEVANGYTCTDDVTTGVGQGVLRTELVKNRDEKYNISTDQLHQRAVIAEPEWINPMTDYWKQHGQCFDIVTVEMNHDEQFP